MTAISSKLPLVGTTIFTTMSALATEYGAVNLGQGFPDFPMDEGLIEAVSRAMRNQLNQYAPMPGYLPLREILSEKIFTLYGAAVDPQTEITITPGGTYAIYTAFTCFLQPGDEVIVPEPAYDSYVPNILANGAVPVLVPLSSADFSIDWPAVRAAVTLKTRAIIINSPHNPTGAVLHEQDIEQLKALVDAHDLIIISDEVYEHLIFDNLPHLSILRYPELLARSFVCFSFGKVFHCTGWKLGYCIAPAALTKEFRKLHQFNCFSCHTPAQAGIAEYLQQPAVYQKVSPELQAKRDFFIAQMKRTRFTLRRSSGSYFICAGYEKISSDNAVDFAQNLVRHHGVATIPISAFYQNGSNDKLIRFCFAKNEATILAAVNQLTDL
jgi:methionine transaminase